jgi:hypothetical protein
MTEEEKVPLSVHSYEVVKKQQYMLESAREYLHDTEPWNTDIEDLEDEFCIKIEDFKKWRNHLLKILGVKLDE